MSTSNLWACTKFMIHCGLTRNPVNGCFVASAKTVPFFSFKQQYKKPDH